MSSFKGSGSRRSPNSAAVAVRRALIGIADAMRGWTDDDIAAFLAGDRELTIAGKTRPAKRTRIPDEEVEAEAARVRAAFEHMDTREEGVEYLDRMDLGRDALRRLTSALDLPVNHSDNMERLRNRIVESLIGYRLRSEAIRGTPQRRREPES